MRTIYRRTLLIAPWLNPYRAKSGDDTVLVRCDCGVQFKAEPGLLRFCRRKHLRREAIAAIIAFQDRYDLSVRLEWDPSLAIPAVTKSWPTRSAI